MDEAFLKDFNRLLQEDFGTARQVLLKEKQLFLETYREALQKKEIEWLEKQIFLKSDSYGRL